MKRLLLFLLISWMTPFAISQQNSDPQAPSKPLSKEEKALVLWQLYELEAARAKIAGYEDWIAREKDLYAKEKLNWEQAIENERKATELANEKTKLAEEKANLYKTLYESVLPKKHGIRCFLGRFFTIGIYRCK
jgi:hypothetical protein